jgi:hypothetical protein
MVCSVMGPLGGDFAIHQWPATTLLGKAEWTSPLKGGHVWRKRLRPMAQTEHVARSGLSPKICANADIIAGEAVSAE